MYLSKKSKAFTQSFIVFSLFFSFAVLLVSKLLYPIKKTVQNADALQKYPTVIIDAGHGGEDGGAVGINGVFEKELNLSISQKLYDTLSASGIDCIMTRSDDRLLYDPNADYKGRKKALDMQARLKIAGECPNAIFVSIHQNTFSKEQYSGLQVYYSVNSPLSENLANSIQNTVKSVIQPSNNRVPKADSTSIYLLRNLSCPAVLVECGFISNREECELLCTEEYQTRLAETISKAIIVFLNENPNN